MGQADVKQRVVVIAGATTALSAAIGRRLAQAGAQVLLAGGEPAEAKFALVQGHTDGVELEYAALDLRQPAGALQLAQEVVGRQGRLDLWVNVAAPGPAMPAEDLPAGSWEDSLAGSVSGAFYGAQAAGRHMLAQGRGVIVNVGAVGGYFPAGGEVAHSVGQGALASLTQALGVEWAARGVRVVGVAVGGLQDGPNPAGLGTLRRTPLHRLGTLEEVAEAVYFLASDEAAYITGETLRVDGGWGAYQLF